MSKIQVSARIRQSFKGESGEKLKLPQQNHESSESFDHVFENSKKCEELYTSCISHLVKPFLNGVNASVVVMGESNSGQISTIFGGEIGNIFKSSKNSSGFLAPLIHDLFRRPIDGGGSSEKPVLKLSVVKVKGNKVEDLLVPPGETQENGNGKAFSLILGTRLERLTNFTKRLLLRQGSFTAGCCVQKTPISLGVPS